jgi:hypothetical protein
MGAFVFFFDEPPSIEEFEAKPPDPAVVSVPRIFPIEFLLGDGDILCLLSVRRSPCTKLTCFSGV